MNKILLYFIDIDDTLCNSKSFFKKHKTIKDQLKHKQKLNNLEVYSGVRPFLKNITNEQRELACFYYLSSRNVALYDITKKWITNSNLPDLPLILKPKAGLDNTSFKETEIKGKMEFQEQKIVIIESGNKALEKLCVKNEWVYLKAKDLFKNA